MWAREETFATSNQLSPVSRYLLHDQAGFADLDGL